MSSNTYYYGEIVAKLAGRVFPVLKQKTDLSFSENENAQDAICSLCADAGRVWNTFEDLSGEHFIDWQKALDEYSDQLRNFILKGQLPSMADLMSMSVRSMDMHRAQNQGLKQIGL